MSVFFSNQPLLSVIVVTYKQQRYLLETIQSILSQTYRNIELIIADDGTPNFDADSIIKYIDDNKGDNLYNCSVLSDGINRGTVKNINIAICKSTGDYIKIIGGDDAFYANDCFEKEISALLLNSHLFGTVGKSVQCDCYLNPIYDKRINKSNKAIPLVLSLDNKKARKYIAKKDIFPIAIQSTCFRRTFFDENGMFDEDYVVLDDAPMVIKILNNSKKFVFLDENISKHRSMVGISTSKELFAKRRILYYKDCVTYSYKEIKPNAEVYGRLFSSMIPKVNKYVYDMALLKIHKEKKRKCISLTLKNFVCLTYFFLKNPLKIIKRIVSAL